MLDQEWGAHNLKLKMIKYKDQITICLIVVLLVIG